jgi:hypothetical protein
MHNMRQTAALFLILSSTILAYAGEPALSVSIAVPSQTSERRVDYRDRSSHFNVVLSNTSGVPQRVWQDWCSWGHYALSFELVDDSGKRWVAKRPKTAFSRNFPSWWTLAPGESLVFDVYFGDERAWEGFPRLTNGSQTLAVTAVFEVPHDKEAEDLAVWTGRVVSDTRKLTFHWWPSGGR